jgi:2-polyprenyl-6-methoxyphenol hydroxylase-like FAD-dependent oxidoreductase
VIIVGAGLAGLATASLLGADGHDVVVLEQDPNEAPSDAETAWAAWTRRGVGQFRQAYGVQPGLTRLLAEELPEVNAELERLGACHLDWMTQLHPGASNRDEHLDQLEYHTLTARRPVMEAAFAAVAGRQPGVTIERGVAVRSYCAGSSAAPGIPHVAGVELSDGRVLPADLVIDATGRHSQINERVQGIGGKSPLDTYLENRTVYYTRYYRSRTGTLPTYAGGDLFQMGQSIGLFLIPSDNATWCLALWGLAEDQALRPFRRLDVFDSVVRRFPGREEWLDGEALTDVAPIVSAPDLTRRFVIDHEPVVTGLLPVGDTAGFTEPRAGRGTLLAVLGAQVIRDALRTDTDDQPADLVARWDDLYRERVGPWLRNTNTLGKAGVREVRAYIAGESPAVDRSNSGAVLTDSLLRAARVDGQVGRWLLDIAACTCLPSELLSRPGVVDAIQERAADAPAVPAIGPSRRELLSLLVPS